jgi:hypothetical protein
MEVYIFYVEFQAASHVTVNVQLENINNVNPENVQRHVLQATTITINNMF